MCLNNTSEHNMCLLQAQIWLVKTTDIVGKEETVAAFHNINFGGFYEIGFQDGFDWIGFRYAGFVCFNSSV